MEIEQAERQSTIWREAARLRYGRLRASLKKRAAQWRNNACLNPSRAMSPLLKEEVDSRERSPRWFPSGRAFRSSKLLEGEREKLIKHGRPAASACGGSGRSGRTPCLECHSDARERACRTRTGQSAASSSWGRPASEKTELASALAEFLFDDEDRAWSAST